MSASSSSSAAPVRTEPLSIAADLLAKVAQNQNEHPSSIQQTERPNNASDDVELHFQDGVTDIYDIHRLRDLVFFKDDATTKRFAHFPQPIFKTIFALVVEKLPLHKALPKALFQKLEPDLVEKLCEALVFFNADAAENEALIEKIEKELPNLLSLKVARKLYAKTIQLARAPAAASSASSSSRVAFSSHSSAGSSSSSSTSSSSAPSFRKRDRDKEEEKAEALPDGKDDAPSNKRRRTEGTQDEPTSSSSSSASSAAASGSSHHTSQKMTILLLRAQEMCLQAHLFENDKEARAHFDEIVSCQSDKGLAEQHITRLEKTLARHATVPHAVHISAELEIQKREIQAVTADIARLKLKVDFTHLSMMQRQGLAEYVRHEDPALRKVAENAKAILEEYRLSVTATLRICNADLTREDLLAYLIGPKGYLLEHYGFQLNGITACTSTSNPFIFNNKGFFYKLTNAAPYVLEQEIRDDLQRIGVSAASLPAPLIVEKKFTKKQTKEAIRLRSAILPTLQRFSQASAEDVVLVKEALLGHFSWLQKGLNSDQIKIKANKALLDAEKIEVVFPLWKRRLTLNLWDVSTIYIPGLNNEVCPMPAYEMLSGPHQGSYTQEYEPQPNPAPNPLPNDIR